MGAKMRKWWKTSFWSEMSMKLKSGMLKIPPRLGLYVGNTPGGPLPLPAMFSCAFEASYYASCIFLRFCERKLSFLITWYFFTRDAKYPFYLRKIQVNAWFYPRPLPFTPKHKPTCRVQCIPCVQGNMEAFAGIFLCNFPIIESHVSKWYSTTK